MFKRPLSLLICILTVTLCGCSQSQRIDKTSLAEAVTVSKSEDNGYDYTFYLLSNNSEPVGVKIVADSFEQAVALAKENYIPNLSLAKLEIFITDSKIYETTLEEDMNFLAESYIVSPQLLVALSDRKSMNFIAKSKEVFENVKNIIILNKNKSAELQINLLSIFNNFNDERKKEFYISYINSENELKITPMKIYLKK